MSSPTTKDHHHNNDQLQSPKKNKVDQDATEDNNKTKPSSSTTTNTNTVTSTTVMYPTHPNKLHLLSGFRVPTLHDVLKFTQEFPKIIHIPSLHIEFNSNDITKMGIKTSWKEQSQEFQSLLISPNSTKGQQQQQRETPPIKRLLFIRHGEGLHNAAERELGKDRWENHEAKLEKYFDPSLNDVGREQATTLRNAITPVLKNGDLIVDAIVVSPLSRAIETAEITFEALLNDDGVPMFAVEMARERHGKNSCDGRRTVSELKKRFPRVSFDYFMLHEDDPWHIPTNRETPEQVRKRVEIFMHWALELPFDTIAVVGHSDYMSHAVEVAGYGPHWPSNCELVPMIITAIHGTGNNKT
jgi:broad specificity phosphatase PhoE